MRYFSKSAVVSLVTLGMFGMSNVVLAKTCSGTWSGAQKAKTSLAFLKNGKVRYCFKGNCRTHFKWGTREQVRISGGPTFTKNGNGYSGKFGSFNTALTCE